MIGNAQMKTPKLQFSQVLFQPLSEGDKRAATNVQIIVRAFLLSFFETTTLNSRKCPEGKNSENSEEV